jgi:hypothetical protein
MHRSNFEPDQQEHAYLIGRLRILDQFRQATPKEI